MEPVNSGQYKSHMWRERSSFRERVTACVSRKQNSLASKKRILNHAHLVFRADIFIREHLLAPRGARIRYGALCSSPEHLEEGLRCRLLRRLPRGRRRVSKARGKVASARARGQPPRRQIRRRSRSCRFRTPGRGPWWTQGRAGESVERAHSGSSASVGRAGLRLRGDDRCSSRGAGGRAPGNRAEWSGPFCP